MADLPIGSDEGAQPVVINDATTTANTVKVYSDGTIGERLYDGSGSAVSKGQSTMSGSLPVAIASDQSVIPVRPVPVGSEGNAWSAASVSSGGNSNVIDLQYVDTVTIMGNVSGNVNPLRIQASMDNTNFYTITTISATAGNFGTTITFGARYLRLQSGQGGAAVTITATVTGK